METFGSRLSKMRQIKRYTQKEMADLLGITQPGYSKYEYNQREPTLETLARLSELLDVSIDYLIKGGEFEFKNEIPSDVKYHVELIHSITNNILKREKIS